MTQNTSHSASHSKSTSDRTSNQTGDQSANDFSRSFAFTSRIDDIVAWGRKNALWPLPYGTACCGIELMSVMGPRYDLARFGAEVVRFSPRQADLLVVAGTITEKMAPVLVRIYQQMLEPKYVLSMGACASSGGFYRAYHVLQGCDKVIPVDVYVPGCPPTPEAVLDGIMTLQRMIAKNQPRPWKDNWRVPDWINQTPVTTAYKINEPQYHAKYGQVVK
jgi:NADH-quinone oxidoreductase subunit B